MKRMVVFLAIFLTTMLFSPVVKSQCSMCTLNAEQGSKNGNTQTKGINDGVLYLLAIPYILIAGVGVIWYKNYRKKNSVSSFN